MSGFWNAWPSGFTEALSGLVTIALAGLVVWAAQLKRRRLVAAFVVAQGLSGFYELVLDRNGWSLTDVWQREVGIVLGLALYLCWENR